MKTMKTLTKHLVMLILPMLLGFTACSDSDSGNEDMRARAAELEGMWWAMFPQDGTVVNSEEKEVPYTHICQAMQLNADGTGYVATFYFNNDFDNPLKVCGGKGFAPITFTSDAEGNIYLSCDKIYHEYAPYYKTWKLTKSGNRISMNSENGGCLFERATPEETDQIVEWDYTWNGGYTPDEHQGNITANIENAGMPFTMQFPFTLNNVIDKYGPSGTEDRLDKNGSISIEFRVYPAYVQSSNGNQAGDYYFVTAAVIPHNNSLWGPYSENHFWSQIRIYGYWFKELDFHVQLLNEDGTQVEGLRYYERPIPENKDDSRSYTKGKTISLGVAISGGASEKQGPHAEASCSFGATWSTSSSYSLSTISYTLDTSTPTVKYHYYTDNVKLSDDMDNIEANFPTACHTEFTGRSCWVWFVPHNGKDVKDSSTKRFLLKASVDATYSSWYHWRGTSEFDSNRKDYKVSFNSGDKFLLPCPDRTPWGVIALKNASTREMAHVRIYEAGKENGEPVATVAGSFSKDQIAKYALKEGTYTICYDLMNPNTNKVLSRWKITNIKVHQGKDEATATTSISTVDAVEI